MWKLIRTFLILASATCSNSFAALNCPVDSKDEYPAIVKITRKVPGDEFYCTGTIVQKCFVLTASHCLTMGSKDHATEGQPSEFSVRGGPQSEKDFGKVIAVKKFPGFSITDKENENHDVGILKLEKCVEHSMEIDFSPMTGSQDVVVGGYGAVKLGDAKWQPSRKTGPNKINHFDENKICLGAVTVKKDGVKLKNSSYCLPVGQDSGGPLIQNGKIRGVFTKALGEWNRDESTLIKESCYVNLRDPKVKEFLQEVLSGEANTQSNPSTNAEPGAR